MSESDTLPVRTLFTPTGQSRLRSTPPATQPRVNLDNPDENSVDNGGLWVYYKYKHIVLLPPARVTCPSERGHGAGLSATHGACIALAFGHCVLHKAAVSASW